MPAIYSHFLILEEINKRYPLPPEASRILKQEALTPYAYWGSMGPDFLFFYPPDWQGPLGLFFDQFFTFDKTTREILSVFSGVSDILGKPTQVLQDMLTGGAYDDAMKVVSALGTTMLSHLAALGPNMVDVFDYVEPPMHSKPTQRTDWWWMDIGHHCRTTDYARSLWKHSEGNDALRAYTLGYLTHIGADVVGHAYVNTLCGGSYRNHWRRHVLVEKCLDTYLYDYLYPGKSISDSELYQRIHFDDYPYDFPKMPGELADFIARCLSETYHDIGVNTPVPNADNVILMYENFYRWTQASSNRSMLNLPPPPPFDWWDLPEEIRERLAPIGQPPRVIFPPANEWDTPAAWKRLFRSLFRFLEWAATSLTVITALPTFLVARIATTGVRYLIWWMLKLVYELYESSRIALAIAGLAYPEKKHLDKYFSGIISPHVNSIMEIYPFERIHNREQTYHLVHPYYQHGKRREEPGTTPFFHDAFEPAAAFLGKRNIHDLSGFDRVCLDPNLSPIHTEGPKISCTDFGYQLIRMFEEGNDGHLPNWNLDVDRGLGWPQWIAVNPKPWNGITDFNFETCP